MSVCQVKLDKQVALAMACGQTLSDIALPMEAPPLGGQVDSNLVRNRKILRYHNQVQPQRRKACLLTFLNLYLSIHVQVFQSDA